MCKVPPLSNSVSKDLAYSSWCFWVPDGLLGRPSPEFSGGHSTGRIWLDNVSCGGHEKSIAECQSRGWGNSDCSHEEDAGVICKDERIAGFTDSNVIEVSFPEDAARERCRGSEREA